MPRAERQRGQCPVCPKECAITDEGGVRFHFADAPEHQAGPDSRKCRGVGEPPAGAKAPSATGYVCRVRECGRPVELTANRRARSHLGQDMVTPCPGGSDWPLRVDPKGNKHDTAPASEPRPAVGPEGLRLGDVFEGQENNRTITPVMAGAFDPRDPDGPGQEAEHDETTCAQCLDDPDYCPSSSMNNSGPHVMNEIVASHRALMDQVAGRAETQIFDPTHVLTTDLGPEVHPGQAADCRLPGCCTHPQGFGYGDDNKGHSGSFCLLCGAEEPEPEPGPDDWRTPAGLLADMPESVRRTVDADPECWDCGHEVTPRAHRFGPDSRVTHVVWECSHGSRSCHPGRDAEEGWCRPQLPEQARTGELEPGECFTRHQAKPPLNRLVYRVQAQLPDGVEVLVVGSGPYAGRTGHLTNLQEEITCTDQHGHPQARKGLPPDRVTGATSPSSPGPSRPSTPSPAEPTTPAPSPAPSSMPSTTPSAPPTTASSGAPSSRTTPSGPTGKAATPTRSASVTDPHAKEAAAFLGGAAGSRGEAEARYGRWGRYKLRHPSTGATVEWTRATTFAKSVSDTYTLSQWGDRCVIVGAVKRPDLLKEAVGLKVKEDREKLNDLAEKMKEAAGAKVAADWGTAVHSWTERCDRAWERRWEILRDEVPEQFQPHVKSYLLLLEAHGLVPVASLIEFSTAVLQYEVMGTSDNCYLATKHLDVKLPRKTVRVSPGEFVIGDKKTGADLSYGWQEITIQLSLYAHGLNGLGRYDWAADAWVPKPLEDYAEPGTQVREDVGVILHLPVDPSSTKPPAVHGVDLESGWNAVVLCERVRVWRKLKNLAGPIAVVETGQQVTGNLAVDVTHVVRPPTLRERAEAVTSRSEASAVYQDAVAAKIPLIDLNDLVRVMQAAIDAVNEPGGSKI